VRTWLTGLLTDQHERDVVEPHLRPLDEVTLHLPFEVADYVDFYCSIQHATNVGKIFRPDGEALLPNWRHLPVGYHGRAGTVVVSGTPIRRPTGQTRPSGDDDRPAFGPSRRLDIEAELGFVVGTATELGTPVPTDAFTEHVFGVLPLNDWSARDIQAWEYVPLGPFLGKSFATSVSPWVTPLAALEAARVPLPGQDPAPLDYLAVEEPAGYDIAFEVVLNGEVVSRPPYAAMYWSPAQMLAHMTVNGASLRTGDLFASGTISGDEREQRGSFLELSWGGTEPFADGRTFLEDGDEVVLRATAPGALGGRVALGEVSGRIVGAQRLGYGTKTPTPRL
jgi:fumarylacetoacetase